MPGSFSQETKDILSVLPVKAVHCRKAELAAIIAGAGYYDIGEDGRLSLLLQSENPAVIRRSEFLIRSLTGMAPEVSVFTSPGGKAPVYSLLFRRQDRLSRLLTQLNFLSAKGVLREPGYPAQHTLLKNECCRRAFLRGSFLAGGFVSDPHSAYHLELLPVSEEREQELLEILSGFEIPAKSTLRKNNRVVYVKDSQGISDMLSLMGAFKSRLEWENVRILRGIQGRVNRQVNCETANLTKTVTAGAKQAAAIEKLEAAVGIRTLPEHLQEIALLRMEHPDVSLPELGEMLHPPAGKSAVNHRLRKLMQLAEELEGQGSEV